MGREISEREFETMATTVAHFSKKKLWWHKSVCQLPRLLVFEPARDSTSTAGLVPEKEIFEAVFEGRDLSVAVLAQLCLFCRETEVLAGISNYRVSKPCFTERFS